MEYEGQNHVHNRMYNWNCAIKTVRRKHAIVLAEYKVDLKIDEYLSRELRKWLDMKVTGKEQMQILWVYKDDI